MSHNYLLSGYQVGVMWMWISVSCSILSIFGSSFMLFTFLRFSQRKMFPQLIACLGAGDLFWAIFTLIQSLLGLYIGDTTSHQSSMFCLLQYCLEFAAYLSVWYTCAIAFYLFYVSVYKESEVDPWIKFGIHSISIFLAFAVTLVDYFWTNLKGSTAHKESVFCFGSHGYEIFSSALITFAFAWNALFTGLIIWKMASEKVTYRTQREAFEKYFIGGKLLLYLLVFFIVWSFELIFLLFSGSDVNTHYVNAILGSIAMVTNNMQGALDCIVYGFVHTPLRKNYSLGSAICAFFYAPFVLLPASLYYAIRLIIRSRSSSELNLQETALLSGDFEDDDD
eukprot:TRINITY_DN534_c0_g1_i1.p1 TRINITY_DN534_c0_g1~~TRINITY_DN534_c0_g1_i1.p1  ORF type:complete len:337 (+),score=56.12 TRINITY_DN534_c0_g1_i1:52-1062(+)